MSYTAKLTVMLTLALILATTFALADVPQMINYQGWLTDADDNPVTDGDYDIVFTIYDSESAPSGVWYSGIQSVHVEDGRFSYLLGSANILPDTLFNDTVRWLGIKVGTDPEIEPRTRLLTVPYAFNAKNGGGWTDDGTVVRLTDSSDNVNIGGDGPYWNNLYVESSEGTIGGATAFIKNTNESDGMGLMIENASSGLSLLISQQGEHSDGEILRCDSYTGGWKAVHRIMNNGRTIIGNIGYPLTNTMLQVESDSVYAAYFTSDRPCEMYNTVHVVHAQYTGNEVVDQYHQPIAIYGKASYADYGTGGVFVGGRTGVFATTNQSSGMAERYIGVHGFSQGATTINTGLRGQAWGSGISEGIIAEAGGSATNYGIYAYAHNGTSNWAGWFEGNVHISGTLYGGKAMSLIDHPLDPENKYLYHSFVESPEMKNVYDGVVTLDAGGEAIVGLPDYFDALNEDFRYQLTCIGGFAPVYVAEKISNNRFKIAGGQSGMEVSWQVTGIRKDAFARANPMEVEVDKPENEIGKYLAPEALGYGPEMYINYEQNQHVAEPPQYEERGE